MIKDRKKILVIAEVFYPEDFLINDVVSEWTGKGYDIEVMARVPSYPYGETYDGYRNKWGFQTDHYKGAKVHRLPFVKGYKESVIRKILNYIAFVVFGSILAMRIGNKFDRIFIYHTGPLTLALPGILAKKVYEKPVVIWTQDLWLDTVFAYGFGRNKLLESFLNGLVRTVYKNCETIFVTCKGFKKRINEYVPDKEIITAPNWPITDGIKNEQPDNHEVILPEGFNFTFTGNVGKVQNLDNVILAFEKFQKKKNKAWLNIVGDGSYLEELKKIVKDKKIDGVKFWGRYPLNTMPDFYQKSDVLLFSLIDKPIYELTIPLKFQTYLTAGKPIFGIIKGDGREIIESNRIGLTANPADINDISNTFRQFLDLNSNEQFKMGVKAKSLLNEEFNKSVVLEKITSKVMN